MDQKKIVLIAYQLIFILCLGSVFYFLNNRTAIYSEEREVFVYEQNIDQAENWVQETDEWFQQHNQTEPRIEPTTIPSTPREDEQTQKPLPARFRSIQEKYNAIKKNKKAVGWITIPGIQTDNAIMYDSDNSYYLTHAEDGQESKHGSIYLDSSSQGEFGQITLLHGHNMRSGLMFGELDFYKDQLFATKNSLFQMANQDGIFEYQIFSVFVLDGNKEKVITHVDTQQAYDRYVKQLKNRSLFPIPAISVNEIKRVVLLHTCSYEFPNAHLIVCAYPVTEGSE